MTYPDKRSPAPRDAGASVTIVLADNDTEFNKSPNKNPVQGQRVPANFKPLSVAMIPVLQHVWRARHGI